MPRTAKPGVDWPAIRARYESGEAANSIAKDNPVSKQGIMKRAKREAWGKPETLTLNTPQWLPMTTSFKELLDRPAYTPAKCAKALDAIAQNANHSVASALIGISRETWRIWRETCPALKTAVELAQASQAMEDLRSIGTAAKSDWKAAERRLAANPLTREDYKQDTGGGGLHVTINVHRATEADMVDVTPRRVEG